MRHVLMMLAVAGAMVCAHVGGAVAAPAGIPSSTELADQNPLVDKARVFCYRRSTGQFLHWGPCGGYRPTYYYSRPRYTYRYRYYRPRYHYRRYYRRWR